MSNTTAPVITAPKLSTVKNILPALRKIDTMRRDETISALFHAMVNNNISFLDNAESHDIALFDVTIKKFFPVNMVKNDKKEFVCFKYSKEKNIKFKTELGISDDKDNKIEWNKFYGIMFVYWTLNHVKAKNDQLSAEELFNSRKGKLENMIKVFLTNGGNKNMINDMIIKLEKTMPNLVEEVKASNEDNKEDIKPVDYIQDEVKEEEYDLASNS